LAKNKESLFQKKVQANLDRLPYTWHFRYHGILAGMPDLMGCCNGRFFALEVKVSATARRSKLQEFVLKRMDTAGAYATFVYPENFEVVMAYLQRIAYKPNDEI